MDSDPTKQERCINSARDTMLMWAAGLAPTFMAAVTIANKTMPGFAKTNWRIKVLGSSVATVALSYYKGERAMIDCVQEYEQRARLKARRMRQQREEAAAAGVQTQQQ